MAVFDNNGFRYWLLQLTQLIKVRESQASNNKQFGSQADYSVLHQFQSSNIKFNINILARFGYQS